MKDLTHYFGQSPKSDESSSSLKENDASSTPAQDKAVSKKPASSDVLKCKTPGDNMNIEAETPKAADLVTKTPQKNSSVKRKPFAKKKAGESDDEDFQVKGVKKTVRKRGKPIKQKNLELQSDCKLASVSGKKRGRPKMQKNLEEDVPDAKLDVVPENISTNADIESPIKGSKNQSNLSKKQEALVSPTTDDSPSGTKPKSAENIMHFFSPTKKHVDVQPNVSKAIEDGTESQNQSTAVNSEKDSIPQPEEKNWLKRASARKVNKKVEEKSSDGTQLSKSLNDDGSDTKGGVTRLPSKESCERNTTVVKSNVCNAFQMLMSKKPSPPVSTVIKDDEDQSSSISPDQEEDDDFQNRTPEEFVKRKKRNRIESETEDDCQSEVGNEQKKIATEVDATPNQDESKRKSLMNYFQKISKEEADAQSQKVQFKVEAIIHHSDGSPYKSKSKKETGSKKKIKKRKTKQKRDENEIEWLGSEEITVEDTSKKPVPMPEVLAEFGECQEDKTKAERNVNPSFPTKAKRTLKLNSSLDSTPKSKRLKKSAEPTESEGGEDTPVQAKDSGYQELHGADDEMPEPVKNSAKIFKQVSLESTFFKKQSSNDTAEVVEAPKNPHVLIMKSFPTVSLKKMSPSKLKKAKNAKELLGEASLEGNLSSTKDTSSNVQVVVSCDGTDMRSLPHESRGIFIESPQPPKQPQSDVTTRLWKMRVCLTPKPGTVNALSPMGSPVTVETDSDDDDDIQEIVAVKKKMKNAKSFDCEVKEKEVEIVCQEKGTSSNSKNAVKLAPLFMRPKKPDRVSEQAKLEFLQSGVPEQVKKMVEVQKSMEYTEVELFPQVSHVTQLDPVLPWTPSESHLPLKVESCESDPVPSESLKMGDVTSCDPMVCEMAEKLSNCNTSVNRKKRRIAVEHLPAVLSLIRTENPNFQVIRYFKLLREKFRKVLDSEISVPENGKRKRPRSSRRSRGSNQPIESPKPVRTTPSLMWTDKYRPTSSEDIIGNELSVQQLKEWLEELRKNSEAGQAPVFKPKRSKKHDREDDFVVFDENFDSNSSSGCLSNSALLLGPHGSGKTNCVYALAADLGYKVLEINASERRNGKIILAKLSEATQSHQVDNRSQEQGSATANLFTPKTATKPKANKRKIPKKKEREEESAKNKLSLILIKDIDIVFEEEDEGFVSAVASLISTSKRPVIFTTTEADSAPLKRLTNPSTLLLGFEPDTKALCSWLQLVALVEGIYVSRDALNDLLSLCNGDVRRCLLQLQVWMSTGGNHLVDPTASKDGGLLQQPEKALLEEFLEYDIEEDGLTAEINRSFLTTVEHHDCIGALQGRNDVLIGQEKNSNTVTIPVPMSFGRVWWNIPQLLSLPQVQVSQLVLPDIPEEPRRFRGIFDDSLFDMTSDDEDLPESQSIKPAEDTDPPAENKPKPAESEPETESLNVERCSQGEVDAMLSHLQALSTCDLIATASHLPELSTDLEPTPRSWQNIPRASISQSTPMTDGPNLFVEEISRSLCHWLIEKSIERTRSVLQGTPAPGRYDALLPDRQIQRRRLQVADSEGAALEVVASFARLERSAVALDYLPTLRRIGALEQKRSEKNCTRRNRFYHYFKNLGLSLSQDQAVLLSST